MRNYLIPALAISLLSAVIIASLILSEQSKRIQGLQSANSSLNSQMEIRKNIEGKLLYEKQTAVMRVKELEQSMPKLAAAITRDFDIKLKNLAGYLQTNFQVSGSGNSVINRIPYLPSSSLTSDSNNRLVMSIQSHYLTDRKGLYWLVNNDTIRPGSFTPFAVIAQDGYLDFQADVYDSINAPYTYTYTDTAKMAFLMKRDKWWKQKKLYGSVLFSNPKAQVLNTQSILVKEFKQKRFGIGPYLGVGIDSDARLQTNFGISVHYSLIRF